MNKKYNSQNPFIKNRSLQRKLRAKKLLFGDDFDDLLSSYNGISSWVDDNGDDSGGCDRECNGCPHFERCHG